MEQLAILDVHVGHSCIHTGCSRWKLSPSMTMQHLHIPERVLACMEWHEHFLGKDYEWEMWNTAFIKLHMETQDAASTSPINNLVAFASWLNKTAQWRYMYRKVPTERSPKLQRYPVKNTGWAILRVRCEKVKKSGPLSTKAAQMSTKKAGQVVSLVQNRDIGDFRGGSSPNIRKSWSYCNFKGGWCFGGGHSVGTLW